SLKPDNAVVYNNIGNALQGQGKLDEAIEAYNKTLALKPDYAEAYNNMGNALKDQGKLEEAIRAYKNALSIKPDHAGTYNNMGNVLKDQGKLDEAITSLNKALSIKPDYAVAYNNMGNVLKDQGKLDEAITSYNKALSLKPDYADAYYNMGNALQDQGKLEEAVQAYIKALAINSDYAEAYNNMGNVLQGQGKLDEAIEAYNKALALKPDYAEAYNNMGRTYYLKGEIQKGLELLEYRFKKQKAPTRAPREKLYWNGSEPIKGKEFLVYEEQGLGDIIQFCRYLPSLVKKGAKVTFKVTQKLHALLRTLDSDIILVDRLPDESQIDFEAPLMSLPHLLNISLETIPPIETYLSADYLKVVSWGKLLNTRKFKIGICWQGSKNKIDIGRSFPLSLFEGISKLPNVELISLHKGEGEKQIQEIKFNLTTLGSNFDAGQDAFLDTSAVIENCDLVITSDTAVAHLAGSLGCTTWLILKYIPDWRWMFDRDDCHWYPTMTLYRQKTPGNWADVFSTVEQKLLSKLEEGK
ncbi:tetratricopeptide repeat protein, partial [Amylibacter sp.]|nr:tetratricopeptide repeat protein [Amylibacter sp.]